MNSNGILDSELTQRIEEEKGESLKGSLREMVRINEVHNL